MLKRVLLSLAIGLLVFGAVSLADTAIPETPGAHVGGTLTIGVSQTFKDMDPRIMNDVYSGYVTGEIFDDLVALDPETLKPQPYIAKSWELVGNDTLRFHLNEGIEFTNGEPLTADDVAFTFNWTANPANNSPNFTELTWMKEAKVIDDYTVDIVMKPDYAPYAPAMIACSRAIVPHDTVVKMGDDEFDRNPVGSGPYRFVEWKAGDHITLVRNEDYWLVYPNLEKIVYRPIPTLATMMLELEAGGIDIADNVPAQDVARLKANPDVDILQAPSLSYFYVFFNFQHAPGNDIRYRKAVYMSVNWDAAVFSIFQGLTGVRAYGCIPPKLWANDRDYLQNNVALEEDDAQAKKLFAELKADGVIPEDYTTTIYCPVDPRRTQLATILATNLEENGLNAKVQPLDWGPYLDLVYRSESDPTAAGLDQGILGWSGGPDPNDFIYYLFHSDNSTVGSADNLAWYENPKVDALIKQASTTLDQAKREELYVEAQRIIYEDYAHIPGYHYIETVGLRTRVQGFIIDAQGYPILCDPYHNVWVKE